MGSHVVALSLFSWRSPSLMPPLSQCFLWLIYFRFVCTSFPVYLCLIICIFIYYLSNFILPFPFLFSPVHFLVLPLPPSFLFLFFSLLLSHPIPPFYPPLLFLPFQFPLHLPSPLFFLSLLLHSILPFPGPLLPHLSPISTTPLFFLLFTHSPPPLLLSFSATISSPFSPLPPPFPSCQFLPSYPLFPLPSLHLLPFSWVFPRPPRPARTTETRIRSRHKTKSIAVLIAFVYRALELI